MFQSARPVRDATYHGGYVWCYNVVSIRAPREGRDSKSLAELTAEFRFNPRAP